MAIFGPRANLFMNIALLGTAGVFAFLLILIWVVPVMGYNAQERYTPPQPVPFSHQAPRQRPRPRLPVLPYHGGDLAECGHSADPYLHDLPLTDLDQCRNPRTGAAEPGRGQATALDRSLHLARLRLFRPQHPHCQRRRLHRMSRADWRHAADPESVDALYELVPLLPPRSSAASAAAKIRCSIRIGSAPPTRRRAKN